MRKSNYNKLRGNRLIIPRKKLGQHFLKSMDTLRHIVDAGELTSESFVFEIGAGSGNLTEGLARKAGNVVAVELDSQFQVYHLRLKNKYPNLKFIRGDVLKLNFSEIQDMSEASDVVIVGNIPYQITTPLIMKILKSGIPFRRMVLMVQKEVGERLTASPGGKTYNALSIKVQYFCKTSIIRHVPRSEFSPPPKVDSVLVLFTPVNNQPYHGEKRASFFELVNRAFGQKRKTLLNSLGSGMKDSVGKSHLSEILKSVDIDPGLRPEKITRESYQKLFEALITQNITIFSKS